MVSSCAQGGRNRTLAYRSIFPPGGSSMILTQTLSKAVKFFPKKKAIVCGEHRWSYQEFDERVNRLSRTLTESGIRKDDKVALLLPNCHCFLESYYGIARIGAVSV